MSEEQVKREHTADFYIFKFDREKHNKNVNRFYHENRLMILQKMKDKRDLMLVEKIQGIYIEPEKKPRAKKGEAGKYVEIKIDKKVFIARTKLAYQKNKEAILEKKKKDYHSNKSYKKNYYNEHKEEIKEKYNIKYQEKRTVKLLEKEKKEKEKENEIAIMLGNLELKFD